MQITGERYLVAAVARNLNESTIYKYRLLFKQIGAFAQQHGLRFLKELDLQTLDGLRRWKDGPRSSVKKLERLRATRCPRKAKWIDENPALDIKTPKIKDRPTMPFTHAEILQILGALDKYAERAGVANAQRLKAFVLLLNFSGMGIGDTVGCGARPNHREQTLPLYPEDGYRRAMHPT